MEIKIGIGLDNIIFGMSQEDVKRIIGKPDKITEDERPDGITYYYNHLLIKTNFDKDEDCRLYSIEVFNPDVYMFDQKIMGKEKDEILDLLKSNGYCEIEQEDYSCFETVFCEKIWSTFEFEFNRLRNIEFSPLFGDDGATIIWPMSN